jgi:hypothetical protein
MNRASWAKLTLATIITAGALSFAAPAVAAPQGNDKQPAPLRSSWGRAGA